jgi:hypoxanthine phosphoribosyltransferase
VRLVRFGTELVFAFQPVLRTRKAKRRERMRVARADPNPLQMPRRPTIMLEVGKVLISRDQLATRIAELGKQISDDYRGKDLILVGILRGAILFLADLLREITVPVAVDFMALSSYGAATKSSGVVRILKDLDDSITGRHVLVVEDIVDTGLTMDYLRRSLSERNPASLAICALLDKSSRRVVPVDVHYTGFEIPDKFVVGYGLDYQQMYRNLPHIAYVEAE